MNRTSALRGLAAAALLAPTAAAQGQYTSITQIPTAISDDASTVALGGLGGGGSYLWTPSGGLVPVGGAGFNGISADGKVAAGSDTSSTAGTYDSTTGMWTTLGTVSGYAPCGSDVATAYDVSADGTGVVGLVWNGCTTDAFYYTGSVMTALPKASTGSARANCISANGLFAGGWDRTTNSSNKATYWDIVGGTETFPCVTATNPDGTGETQDMTPDGSLVVGGGSSAQPNAWAWTASGGLMPLGPIPGISNSIDTAWGVNHDGTMIVGGGGSFFTGFEAFIWTAEDGMMTLETFMANQGLAVPSQLAAATDISAHGEAIVGYVDGFPRTGFHWALPDGIKYRLGASPNNTLGLRSSRVRIGRNVSLVTSNVTGPLVFHVLSARSADMPFLGGQLLVDLTARLGPIRTSIPAGGSSTLTAALPNDPALVNRYVFSQSLTKDPVNGWQFSNGLKMTVRM